MTQTILIILGIVIILILLSKKSREQVAGICANALDQTVRKSANKEKILGLLSLRSASNQDIRQIVGVTERSVVRYMDELEKEGKVVQVGDTGRSVTYRLKSQPHHP